MQSVSPAAIVIFVGLMAVSCQRLSEPEKALRSYAGAVSERRCSDSLELISSKTRYALDVLREKPQHAQSPLPLEEYYCNKFTFDECKLDELTLKAVEGHTATVARSCGHSQDSFLPGFSSIFLKYEPRDFELVREDGGWRVALPFVIKIAELQERDHHLREKALQEHKIMLERKGKKDTR